MRPLGTWASGGLGKCWGTVGLRDPTGLFQCGWFYDLAWFTKWMHTKYSLQLFLKGILTPRKWKPFVSRMFLFSVARRKDKRGNGKKIFLPHFLSTWMDHLEYTAIVKLGCSFSGRMSICNGVWEQPPAAVVCSGPGARAGLRKRLRAAGVSCPAALPTARTYREVLYGREYAWTLLLSTTVSVWCFLTTCWGSGWDEDLSLCLGSWLVFSVGAGNAFCAS